MKCLYVGLTERNKIKSTTYLKATLTINPLSFGQTYRFIGIALYYVVF